MKHRGVNLDFLTQAISDNWDEHDQEETTTHHILRRTESGQNNAPQQDVMWKVVGWVGIRALSRSVEAGCIRALVGGELLTLVWFQRAVVKSLQAENCVSNLVLSYPIQDCLSLLLLAETCTGAPRNLSAYQQIAQENIKFWYYIFLFVMSTPTAHKRNFWYKHAFVIKKILSDACVATISPAYIETPQIHFRLRWTYPTKTSEGFIPNIHKISYTRFPVNDKFIPNVST